MENNDLKQFKKRLLQERKYCQEGMEKCTDEGREIYQGWVEAIDFVLLDKILKGVK